MITRLHINYSTLILRVTSFNALLKKISRTLTNKLIEQYYQGCTRSAFHIFMLFVFVCKGLSTSEASSKQINLTYGG